jgi:flagellar assembly factor FliW
MKINTRIFGEIEIAEDKIITFEEGIIGFPDCKKFALIYNQERDSHKSINWMQSLDEPAFALPVMDPLLVKEDYNPMVEDELLKSLGDLNEENTFILVTVTVPQDLKEISVNLKAPLIINAQECKACQLIIEDDLPVKYKIYNILQGRKAGE